MHNYCKMSKHQRAKSELGRFEDDEVFSSESGDSDEGCDIMIETVEKFFETAATGCEQHSDVKGNEVFAKKFSGVLALTEVNVILKNTFEVSERLIAMVAILPNRAIDATMKSVARSKLFRMMIAKLTDSIDMIEEIENNWNDMASPTSGASSEVELVTAKIVESRRSPGEVGKRR